MLKNEMIFAVDGEKIMSGGYNINSAFLNKVPVSYTLNKELFGGLSVPSGLLYMTSDSKMTNEVTITGGGIEKTVDDELYNKLFDLAKMNSQNKITHLDTKTENIENEENGENEIIQDLEPVKTQMKTRKIVKSNTKKKKYIIKKSKKNRVSKTKKLIFSTK